MRFLFEILSGRTFQNGFAKDLANKIRLGNLGRKHRVKAERELEKLGPHPKYKISEDLLKSL